MPGVLHLGIPEHQMTKHNMGTALSKDKNTVTHRRLGGGMQDSERKTKHRGRKNEVIFSVCV